MLSILSSSLRITAVTWLLCGLVYPLLVNGFSQIIFPVQANGSIITDNKGNMIGSSLIGQNWSGNQWFHGRASATTDTDPNDATKTIAAPYNAGNSSGSNFGPTSQALSDRLTADRKALETVQPELQGKGLPADMLTASASGLDPDISPDNALLQASRVAKARAVSLSQVQALILTHIQKPTFGIFGEPRVNVLALNLALQNSFSNAEGKN
ncbi:potassium-transporting ATPase subunit KdpC [Rouxiella badensis]|jgi:K+-transporting ATPase ATPase C chain|uniref:Potassium-transporting ATPase KdpC subunit n=1 Tax=Rouxiella badensis TaxID=1646377 RepID=A0A1X0WG55_9GAMM|nr:potassium-transporting ATPase subunit KdpC [Rouxiella badensis]MCC3720961.1 potassium-transporting ATPase subunit KdpC [Rouxiella badensis]MCC3729590.1 potassium-transporting ATPase subunit KdpC [Rouxiella badensis]MCC3741258.1 potassium-transporting ATPase subunit KdpC [Rouxiella badensis]ORJ25721.1 potassium-transporting ATPase subunit C [Rouxiella badensis]QII38369.1 potassium-transporting ATPase subunit KdpC [Rouxiella badensis]